ncbi:TPA: darobactin family peptide antibiotic [Vibrio vulnificus]|jgi:hypothetical protein|uniref:darobactin family peptide antibiotic n=1 Tax=Vibrio TaxID=662 RepID=UPI0010E80AE2|nr:MULTISPECIES: darobactin family peptide antibiotic [Vibrio]TCL22196.1 hypothetical protein EDB52_11197 [Vibrio crassostreae]TCT56179.1 hypothetical protein EDB44_13131 [Vibrio crassostreae]TCT76319.1 hypothetical protein EDB43_1314 [Vibrio crassostreae]CAK2852009.1 conserved hypothetical protein [Vibrio crassostreae]CAK3471537.1 conserved hypothetical protein [Vibrio crassostreae]
MIIVEKEKVSISEKLDALMSSFSEMNLELRKFDQEKVNSINIAPPITAWNWSKSF